MEGTVFTPEFLDKIKSWENNKKFPGSGWNEKKQRWYPHPSPEGGLKTIGYGHKIKSAAEQSTYERTGLSDAEAEELLRTNLEGAAQKAMALVPKFTALPDTVKQALTNAAYRGEIRSTHQTIKLINQGNWKAAAEEYLNNTEYKQTKSNSIRNRMNWNYEQFINLAKSDKSSDTPSNTQTSQLIGKTVYPTKKNGYVNVRSESYVDNGIIDNLDTKVMYPKPVGYLISERDADRQNAAQESEYQAPPASALPLYDVTSSQFVVHVQQQSSNVGAMGKIQGPVRPVKVKKTTVPSFIGLKLRLKVVKMLAVFLRFLF